MRRLYIFFPILLIISLGVFIFFEGSFNKHQAKTSSSQLLADGMKYLDYSDQTFTSTSQYDKTILFFAATLWCQTCSELDKEIKERIVDIPSDVTILKVDYDNDREMKARYGVTQQHTLVVLDGNRNEVKRWIGGNFDLMLDELREI